MELERKSSSFRSTPSSKTKIALEFLRVDKARFSNTRTPIPTPPAVVERQRKRMVNKRYVACMMARKQASRENEIKERDNREDIMKGLKSKQTDPAHNPEALVLPWPGFRYHNNGDIRTLSNVQKQRRLLASMRAGQGHRQSTVEVPFLPHDPNDVKPKSSTTFKSRSVDSLKLLMNKRSTPGRFSFDNITLTHDPSDYNSPGESGPQKTTGLPAAAGGKTPPNRRDKSNSNVTPPSVPDRKMTFHRHFNSSSVPSNRSIGSSRLNLNQFWPAVKPLVTSSVWCNGDAELEERASLIPTDSFNIRFGVSSKVLQQRKSDLDQHRMLEENRSLDNANKVRSYIKNVQKQIMS